MIAPRCSMVVAAGQQGHARRRAECRRVEAVVFESLARETIQRGHGNLAAERTRVTEPDVIDQEDDDVRRSLRRFHLEPRRRFGVACVEFSGPWVIGLRDGKDGSIRPVPSHVSCGRLGVLPRRSAAAEHRKRQRNPGGAGSDFFSHAVLFENRMDIGKPALARRHSDGCLSSHSAGDEVAYRRKFASLTNLTPTWLLPVLISPRPRVPTI